MLGSISSTFYLQFLTAACCPKRDFYPTSPVSKKEAKKAAKRQQKRRQKRQQKRLQKGGKKMGKFIPEPVLLLSWNRSKTVLFLQESALHSFSLVTFWLCNFWRKNIDAKAMCKMLMKLTLESHSLFITVPFNMIFLANIICGFKDNKTITFFLYF